MSDNIHVPDILWTIVSKQERKVSYRCSVPSPLQKRIEMQWLQRIALVSEPSRTTLCSVPYSLKISSADIDENSRSRKISWELATRILARSREILFYFSSPSRNSRFDRANSRSRLEARDIEDTNLDLVSNNEIIKISISSRKKTRLLFIFFCWNLLCNNFEASVLFLPTPYGIYVVHSHFPNTIKLVSNFKIKWKKFSISSRSLRLSKLNSRSRLEPWD